jgi:bifunctional ADP-heptose synthase (sugar kinase/adenylyltransferase)
MGMDIEAAAHLANTAASVVVGKIGTSPISLKELQEHV